MAIKIFQLVNDTLIGDFLGMDKTNKLVMLKNPVSILYQDYEEGKTFLLDNPIRESLDSVIAVQYSNIVYIYSPSYELVTYYNNILPKMEKQREDLKDYLIKANQYLVDKTMNDRLENLIKEGKLEQRSTSTMQ